MRQKHPAVSLLLLKKAMPTQKQPPQLSRVLFWDTAYNRINWTHKARYVVERVVMFGTVSDWRAIPQFYGMERIKSELLQSRDLDLKTLHFLSIIFDIPKEAFACYACLQSLTGHWNGCSAQT